MFVNIYAISNGTSFAKKDPVRPHPPPASSSRSVATSSSANSASIPGRRMSALDEADGEDNIHRSARYEIGFLVPRGHRNQMTVLHKNVGIGQ